MYLVALAVTTLYLGNSTVWGPRILLWSNRRRPPLCCIDQAELLLVQFGSAPNDAAP